tara:strand:- start:308 stop:976 length:669 start_codon:yes stop_codon:yes gene_type:complete
MKKLDINFYNKAIKLSRSNPISTILNQKMKQINRKFRIPSITLALFASGFMGVLIYIGNGLFSKANATPSLMEFRWEADDNYKKLYYFQSSRTKNDRATYYLVMKPKYRKFAFLKLSISLPKHFDSKITPKKLTLCKVQVGGMTEKTRCIEKLPAVFEVNKEQNKIEMFPNRPIPVSKEGYAVVMKIFNPSETGMFQLNASAQSPGDLPISSYIGSWSISID